MTTSPLPQETRMEVLESRDGDRSSQEIVHYYSDELFIASTHRRVLVQRPDRATLEITFPRTRLDFLGFSRPMRRALRLDKCNVYPLDPHGSELVLIRRGAVYRYDGQNGLRKTLELKQSRNVLHTDFCQTRSGRIIFGEYGANPDRQAIPIYASDDNGASWRAIHHIPASKAKHVHAVYADKFGDKVWIFTGDADGECWVIEASEDFGEIRYIGDGSQIYRACTAFFTPDKVVWAMDSPLETSRTVHFDRQSGNVELHGAFPGSIWYGLDVPRTGYLVASTVEPGQSVTDNEAGVFFSSDLVNWSRLAGFEKDRLPMGLFKFGVIGFSRGARTDGTFYIFGEALKGLDGRALRCKIER